MSSPEHRVVGVNRREGGIGFDTFADITTIPVVSIVQGDRLRYVITFAEPLTADVRQAVWARLTSIDDVDQADRQRLLDLAAAVRSTNNTGPVAKLALELARYRLGDPDERA